MHQGLGRLEGKVAVVTGGASGIGAAMSCLFAREGAAVAVADVNVVAGETLASQLRSDGANAIFVELNVADAEAVVAAVDRVRAEFGRLDVYANNAGIGSQTSGDEAGWWRLLRINLLGVAWGTREAISAMRQTGGGSIVNTGSHAGLRAARAGVYGASKAAVHTLTRYAALHHAPDRVRVNTVLPGNIYTPIHDMRRHDAVVRRVEGDSAAFAEEPLDHGEDPAEARDKLIEAFRDVHPLGRLATADDIAEAALYLASDEAAAVTGNEFLANGGIMAALMRDRVIDAAGAASSGPTPPPAAPAMIAVVTAIPELAEAMVTRYEGAGLPVAVSPHPDQTDEQAVRGWLEGLGPLAGIVYAMRSDPGGDLFSQGPKEWADQLAVNFRAPWVLAQAGADLLPAGASMTFVTDASGLTGAAASPAYCAASAALTYAAEGFADQLRPRGVRVNAVVAEALGASGAGGLGAPSTPADIAEMVVVLSRLTTLTGLQLSLETSHPYDVAML